jgi:putative membrane protein
MRPNCQVFAKRIGTASIVLAGAVFLSVPSALAQMNPSGGVPQQPTSPPQTTPGSRPGMSPMDQPGMNSSSQENGPEAMMDKAFVHDALEGGLAEVQLGKLAVQKSNNEDVKQFGQKMIDDHTKLGDQMKQVAQQMNVKPPTSLSSKDRATIKNLKAMAAGSFDKAYIKDMIKDHEKDRSDFQAAANRTSNPALKQVATQGAQVIDEHLQLIQQIAQKNNVAAK